MSTIYEKCYACWAPARSKHAALQPLWTAMVLKTVVTCCSMIASYISSLQAAGGELSQQYMHEVKADARAIFSTFSSFDLMPSEDLRAHVQSLKVCTHHRNQHENSRLGRTDPPACIWGVSASTCSHVKSASAVMSCTNTSLPGACKLSVNPWHDGVIRVASDSPNSSTV